MYILLRSIRI